MIFATCGSSHFRFDRMMQALALLPPDELYVQHGPASPPPLVRAVPFLPFDRLAENITRAEVVISHAGVGSILCAVRAGHTPVLFPRLRRYGETVDDHQVELARALAARGSALIAWSADELADAVAAVPRRGEVSEPHPEPLVEAVRASIMAERTGGGVLLGGHLSRR